MSWALPCMQVYSGDQLYRGPVSLGFGYSCDPPCQREDAIPLPQAGDYTVSSWQQERGGQRCAQSLCV